MLPSMPILFSRESRDAFGNKIESSTTVITPNVISNTNKKQETQTLNNEGQKSAQTPQQSKYHEDSNRKEEPNKPKLDENALETALVRSYYTKVKSRFPANSSLPTNKFVQFRDILKCFDPGKETPVDLYRKVKQLFGDEHKDIVEEFLLFLKPGQAAKVGRFMDHFMLTQMTSFIKLLQTTFARKSAVYRKILRAITTSINNGTSQDLKTRVLPHLRTNPRLAQMFKSMFPDDRPPDSAYDGTDIINETFLECDEGYDVWEFEAENKKRKVDVKEGLDSVYLHGRVFLQHGRLLRSASVTYPYSKEPYRVHARRLAPNTCLSPPDSDEEGSAKRAGKTNDCKVPPKRTRKQTKSPTKTVKDVNDNTKKDLKQALSKVKGKVPSKTKCKNEDSHKKKPDVNACVKKDDLSKAKPKDAKKARNWTREEDKTMLEVLKGEGGSDQVIVRICELLPHRSQSEVKERFRHVVNLLQQMAINEVT